MLAQSLQALANNGFVLRASYPVVPPFVEHSLTALGKEVAEHIATLANWIEVNLPSVWEASPAAKS